MIDSLYCEKTHLATVLYYRGQINSFDTDNDIQSNTYPVWQGTARIHKEDPRKH
jgi:hypothetical protein